MKKRILSGIVMVLIAIPVLLLGGIVFDIACSLIAIGAFCELINANKKKYIPNIMRFIGIVCMILLMFINVDGHSFVFGLSFETLSLVFLLILLPTIFLRNQDYKTENGFYLAAVTIFLGTVFNLFLTLYNESMESFVYVILIACMTDIFALFGGKLIGKHKLTTVSPNKTIEGSIVGTIVATIIATTYYIVFIVSNPNIMSIAVIVLITIFLSIMGQLGDLFFSLIKRENNIKDYSNLIPGHGGILDRIDSIIFILIAFIFIIQFI